MFISALLIVDAFFVSYYLGFHSRSVPVIDPSLPPLAKPVPVPAPAKPAAKPEVKDKAAKDKAAQSKGAKNKATKSTGPTKALSGNDKKKTTDKTMKGVSQPAGGLAVSSGSKSKPGAGGAKVKQSPSGTQNKKSAPATNKSTTTN